MGLVGNLFLDYFFSNNAYFMEAVVARIAVFMLVGSYKGVGKAD